MKNLKISTKLVVSFAAVIAVFAAASMMVHLNLRIVVQDATAKDQSNAVINAADDMFGAVVEQQNAVRGFVAAGAPTFLDNYAKEQAHYAAAMDRYRKAASDDARAQRLVAFDAAVAKWREINETQIALAKDPATLRQLVRFKQRSSGQAPRHLAESLAGGVARAPALDLEPWRPGRGPPSKPEQAPGHLTQ